MFGVPERAAILEGYADRYGVTVHFSSERGSVDPAAREITVTSLTERPGAAASPAPR